MAPVQAGIVDFKGIFQDRIRTLVRDGILSIIAQEVTELCGESHHPVGIFERAGTEPVTSRRVRARSLSQNAGSA